MTEVRTLIDDYHEAWMAAHPLDASYMGLSGYDHLMPDATEAGEEARREAIEATLAAARRVDAGALGESDLVSLGCLISAAERELVELAGREVEYLVTTLPFKGPAYLLGLTARTNLPDAEAAQSYLDRLAASAPWIDDQAQRLRIGARRGRLPVAPLVEEALRWVDDVLAVAVPDALAAPQPPADWAGAASFAEERDALVRDLVRPALLRWRETIADLLGEARPENRAGLVHLPGGEAEYEGAIRVHTTLFLTAEEIHAMGLAEVERLEGRLAELGAGLGLRDLDSVRQALRSSGSARTAPDSIDAARAAIRRAEGLLGGLITPPFPSACEVSPMPEVVAAAGTPPHYSPPRLDGTRPGTYWFNAAASATIGRGWELEATAFHEAVPGHHLQFARLQLMTELPRMLREREVSVSSEGWGLYAEQLAEEVELYSGTEALLGAVSIALLRGARLVVDTGLHAKGWSRSRALQYLLDHVPLPEGALTSELDRYISWPGQALAYLIGKLEILRLREAARGALGPRFALPEFHAAILDAGSLPVPVLDEKVTRWAASAS